MRRPLGSLMQEKSWTSFLVMFLEVAFLREMTLLYWVVKSTITRMYS